MDEDGELNKPAGLDVLGPARETEPVERDDERREQEPAEACIDVADRAPFERHRPGDAERKGEERAREEANGRLVVDPAGRNELKCPNCCEERGKHRSRETGDSRPGPGTNLVDRREVQAHRFRYWGRGSAVGGNILLSRM